MSPARRSFYFCKLYRFNPRGNWQQSQELNQYSRTLQHLAAKQLSFSSPSSCSLKCCLSSCLKRTMRRGWHCYISKEPLTPKWHKQMAQGRHWRWIWQIHWDVTNQLILSIKAKWSFHAQRQPTFEYQTLVGRNARIPGLWTCRDRMNVRILGRLLAGFSKAVLTFKIQVFMVDLDDEAAVCQGKEIIISQMLWLKSHTSRKLLKTALVLFLEWQPENRKQPVHTVYGSGYVYGM